MTAAAVSPAPPTGERTAPLEPYRGLVPYSEADAEFFFGRERETEVIRANLRAARLTLLYGESGVGKSSVLLAGAVYKLREEASRYVRETGRPRFAVVVYRTWRDDPVQGVLAEVAKSVSELVGEDATVDVPADASLADALKAWTERLGGDLIVILDQFEEYFLYHSAEDGEGTFAVEFPRAVNRLDLRVSVLLSMREDSLAKLDRFKGRIPFLFDNRLRIDHLSIEAARAAIVRPIRAYNERVDEAARVSIEPALVDKIIEQISGSHVQLGQTGAGDVDGGSVGPAGDRIEAPYLQVVLRRLWLEEQSAGSRVLRAETLDGLGGAENIVRKRLDESMADLDVHERDVAAKVFHYLVTRSGTKVAHTASDLAEFADLPKEAVEGVVEHLTAGNVRVLRPVQPPPGVDGGTRYEIFHDVIGPAILDWRARYVQEKTKRATEEQARRERRKSTIWAAVAVLSLLALAGVAVLAVWAVQQKRSAESEHRAARAQELVAEARAALADDPAVSVSRSLAAIAVRRDTRQAEDVLREALPDFRAQRALPVGDPPYAATVSGEAEPTLIALPGRDESVRIVDAETGREVSTLRGHEDALVGSAFSRDGRRIVTASLDDTARVWDTATGEQLAELTSPDDIYAVAFDSRGERVAFGGFEGKVYLWDAESGARLASPAPAGTEGYILSVGFSGDGGRLVALTQAASGTRGDLWTVSGSGLTSVGRLQESRRAALSRGGEKPRQADTEEAAPFELAELNRDGTLVATARRDGSVELWTASTRPPRLLRTLPGGQGRTLDLAFGPRSGALVAAAQDKAVRVWRTANGERVADMFGHQDWVNAVAFRPDGKNLVSASADGTARVWEVEAGVPLMELHGHSGSIEQAAYAADGRLAVTVSDDGEARVWDTRTGMELRAHSDWVLDAAFSPDGTTLATVGADSRLVTWDARTGERTNSVRADYAGQATSVEFSPDDGGKAILTAGEDTTAAIWDATSLELLSVFAHDDAVLGASFSPDGSRIITASLDSTARVWDRADDDEAAFTLKDDGSEAEQAHLSGVFDAEFSPGDGNRIVTVGGDGIVRIWESENGRELRELDDHEGVVYGVQFSPEDPRLIVTASRDRTARVWDIETGMQLRVLRQREAVTTAAFSPDGSRIVTGSPGGVTRIWDWRGEKLLATMRMHADYINAAAFSADGSLVVTASDDRTAKVYGCEACASLDELRKDAEDRLRRLGVARPR